MKLRELMRFRFTPNQARIIYDFFITTIVAVTVLVYERIFLFSFSPLLLGAPFVVLLVNRLVGIYTRFRVGAGWIKALLLTVSVIASDAFLLGVGVHAELIILWTGVIWSPIVLPRLFLNLSKQVKTNFIKRSIGNRGPVLVVGGGGYIGTYVIEQLLAMGESVRILDRLIHGREPIAGFLTNPRFELIEGDATDIVKLTQAVSGSSAVIHLGGLVGDPACSVDESFTRHANVIATRMVKEVALSLGVTRFIFASSCSVYGANDNEVDETSSLNPVSLYARTKIDSEEELLLCPDEDFCVTVLRFATVFGHSRRPRFDLVTNLFTAQAMIEGSITVMGEDQWRPFIHVRDVARAVVMVLKASPKQVRGEIFNVGDKRLNKTIGQLAETVCSLVEKERPVKIVKRVAEGDRRNYRVSFQKIERVLGFEAETLLEEGVAEIITAFKKEAYQHYRTSQYSNLEMTKAALKDFHDPAQSVKLYRPVVEHLAVGV